MRHFPEPVVFQLQIERGYLKHVPFNDRQIPFEHCSWAATVTDKPQGQYPHTRKWWNKSGGRGFIVPKNLVRGSVVQFRTTRPPDVEFDHTIRSPYYLDWVGVVVGIVQHPEMGFIRLRQSNSVQAAFRTAKGVSGQPLNGKALEAFLKAVEDGDMAGIQMLCDWLEDNGDPRAGLLKAELLRTVYEFFPEAPPPLANEGLPGVPDKDDL